MKIISTNRSDTFDEYLRIISRYNEKNLVKEAAGMRNPILKEVTEDAIKGGEKMSSSIARSTFNASAQAITDAGIRDIGHLKGIWTDLERAVKHFEGKPGAGFIVFESGKWRLPTPDEITKANLKRVAKPNNLVNTSHLDNKNITEIRNFTKSDGIFDVARKLNDGGVFSKNQLANFKILSKEVSEGGGVDAAIRGTSDVAAPNPVINNVNQNIINFGDVARPAGAKAGGSILDTSTLATKRQLSEMSTFFKKSFDSLNATLAGHTAKIDELLKSRNIELLTAVGTKIDDSIKASLAGVTTKVDELSATVTKIDGDIGAINTAVKNLEGKVASGNTAVREVLDGQKKAAEEMVTLRKQMAESLDQMKNMKKELEESVKASRVAASEATPAVTKVTWWAKTKSFLLFAAAIAAAVAGSYWLYNKLTGEDGESEGGGDDGSENTAGNTGDPEGENDGLQNQMDDPARREALIDNAEKLGGLEGDALLNKMAEYYRASGYVKLDEPISINGTIIRYAFPTKVSGGVDPVTDIGRREATKSYLAKAYNESSEKYRDMTTRFATGARSSDPQRIANYAFSITAGSALFSSKGTFLGMGERGKRYGRGKENVGRGDFGMAGTSQKKMTREERRAIKNMNRMSDADDFMQNDINDPMQAFSSGQNDFFHKKAEDINNSTNKYPSYEFAKKADKVSNRYFKDAVQDLQDDEFMKAYYSGFSKLHNEKPKKKKEDYEKLYDLHDETGADLVHEAHPKAITVAEAIGKGGLVENGSERSKAMEDIAFRVPSGNYRARYAFIQEALRKKS